MVCQFNMELKRHDFIWLKNKNKLFFNGEAEGLLIKNWISKGYPLIVRNGCSYKGDVAVGFMNYFDRKRISFNVGYSEILFKKCPPCFSEVSNLNKDLKDFFSNLCDEFDIEIRLFGSYAWEFFVKKTYVRNNSDIDIIIFFNKKISYKILCLLSYLINEYGVFDIDAEVY